HAFAAIGLRVATSLNKAVALTTVVRCKFGSASVIQWDNPAFDKEISSLVRVTDFSCTAASNLSSNFEGDDGAERRAESKEPDGLRVVESRDCLVYHSEAAQCTASLEVLNSGLRELTAAGWSFGLVQACRQSRIEHRYGRSGSAHWVFPELASGARRWLSDSDGTHFPFYGRYSVAGAARGQRLPRQRILLSLLDSFHPTVSWRLTCAKDSLCEIIRQQSFRIWLVATPHSPRQILELQQKQQQQQQQQPTDFRVLTDSRGSVCAADWQFEMLAKFDCARPVGRRLVSVRRSVTAGPADSREDEAANLPLQAVTGVTCNDAQQLVWRAASKISATDVLLIPARRPGDSGRTEDSRSGG
ncbi:hypothetical protein BOX15_Mlig018680g1, partial [Macrostomum lignano]